jgi:hypothetical protein
MATPSKNSNPDPSCNTADMGTVTANMEQPVVDVVAGRSYFCYPLKDTQGNLIRFQMKGGITENILVRFDSGLDPALSPSCEVNVENRVGPLQTFHKREQWPKIVFSGTSDRHFVQLKDENTYFGIRVNVWRLGAIPKTGIRRFVLSLESATTSNPEVQESGVFPKTNGYATQKTANVISDHFGRTEP